MPDQRAEMARVVLAEKAALKEWWFVREEILTLLEDHLCTGLPIDQVRLEFEVVLDREGDAVGEAALSSCW
ncbi:MAG: hypothetical protein ACI8UO_002192 [Verrucomicrobiales bacterium]